MNKLQTILNIKKIQLKLLSPNLLFAVNINNCKNTIIFYHLLFLLHDYYMYAYYSIFLMFTSFNVKNIFIKFLLLNQSNFFAFLLTLSFSQQP
jgi:hypothetical protein